MGLKKCINEMIEVNLQLIKTDRDLQKFMVGAFTLLLIILLYCTFFGNFQQANEYFTLADRILSGTFSYSELSTDLPPLTLLLLIPPRLFSPTPEVYCYLFSLYGFAFYMLGGHFMLKSCRETGFSQRSAYISLFVTFLCSFYFMTLSTGSIAPAFLIIFLWFYHLGKYTVSLISLALATMTGLYPIILFLIMFFYFLRTNRLAEARTGILAYLVICTALTAFSLIGIGDTLNIPFLTIPDSFSDNALLSPLYSLLNYYPSAESHFVISIVVCMVFAVICALQLKKTAEGMRPMSLLTLLALLFHVLLGPIYFPGFYIWIAMLMPMTQMSKESILGKKNMWCCFLLFSATSALCDVMLSPGTSMFTIAGIARMALLLLMIGFIGKDCNQFAEHGSFRY